MSADYERIEQAINYLIAHARARPTLREVATAVGLSEFHFQRLFTRWAGVSPKRFLQFQTVAHARQLLRESRSLLEATYDAGLSSPGRLHDLFVSVDGVTPGEYKTMGEGLTIAWGVHPSPFGEFLLAATARGVCWLAFVERGARAAAVAELAAAWPAAELREESAATGALAARIFPAAPAKTPADGTGAPDPLRLAVRGTNFQLKVWEALLRVPPGALVTYEALAASAGEPRAVRAVASAVARNPVAFLIPCHRVIRKSGALGEYRWGAARKRALVGWEAARCWPGDDEPEPGGASAASPLPLRMVAGR